MYVCFKNKGNEIEKLLTKASENMKNLERLPSEIFRFTLIPITAVACFKYLPSYRFED